MSTATVTGTSPVVTTKKPHTPTPGKRAAVKPATPATPSVEASHKGARSLAESLTPTEMKKEVDALIALLKASTDGEEKKKIRRKLRLRGHRGGIHPGTVKATIVPAPKA